MAELAPLTEVAEASAPPAIAQIYGAIRREMGVPFVALFYRNLAGIDGALDWMWGTVGPLVASGRLESAAARMARTVGIVPLHLLPPPQNERAAITEVIAAYNRANPFNVTCAAILGCILAGESGQTGAAAAIGRPRERLSPAPDRVPPMVGPEDFPPSLRAAVSGLATPDTAGDGIVPSLYRHLANWPDYLSAAAAALAPRFADGSILSVARQIAAAGRGEARDLIADLDIAPMPARLIENRTAVLASVEKFSHRIPEMIVVGRLLAAAVEEIEPT
ncbi:MAG: hypothetical protein HQ495_07530 [Alphaproteobacteria bacterium]|nr:hypothetical protein [Alphaproteobacteria bacterium]